MKQERWSLDISAFQSAGDWRDIATGSYSLRSGIQIGKAALPEVVRASLARWSPRPGENGFWDVPAEGACYRITFRALDD